MHVVHRFLLREIEARRSGGRGHERKTTQKKQNEAAAIIPIKPNIET
jgi:hypothetical protein